MASTQHEASQPASGGEELLIESNSASPLRILSIVAMAFAIGSGSLAFKIMDGDVRIGNAISGFERGIFAAVLVVLLVGFLVGVSIYQRRIATRIVLLAGGQRLRITTPTLFGHSHDEVNIKDVEVSQYHEGDKAGEQATNTPWVYLRVRGSRSYVVPMGNKIPNRDRLLSLLNVER
jgi:hypothetical protein